MTRCHDDIINLWMKLNIYVYGFIHCIPITIVWAFVTNHATILMTIKITPYVVP
jgi:hypothetical protein